MGKINRIELIAERSELAFLYQKLKEQSKWIGCTLIQSESNRLSPNVDDLPISRILSSSVGKDEISGLARHLTRRKIGLALGAGGARGYAQVAALRVFEQVGIPIDYIACSSIGAMVGSFLAMGMNADAIAARLNDAWSPTIVSQLSVFSAEGHSVGLRKAMQAVTQVIGEPTFADLRTSLTIMTADLNAQQAAPISTGALTQALCAGITIPGMIPPYARGAGIAHINPVAGLDRANRLISGFYFPGMLSQMKRPCRAHCPSPHAVQ